MTVPTAGRGRGSQLRWNRKLQRKMDYYYKPYSMENGRTFYMRFDEFPNSNVPTAFMSKPSALLYSLAGIKTWKCISNFILNEDKEQFQAIIQNIQNDEFDHIKRGLKKSRDVSTRLGKGQRWWDVSLGLGFWFYCWFKGFGRNQWMREDLDY